MTLRADARSISVRSGAQPGNEIPGTFAAGNSARRKKRRRLGLRNCFTKSVHAGHLGGKTRAHAASKGCRAGFAGGVSRSGGFMRTGRDELRGSGANGGMPDRDDSFAPASWPRFVDGETGNASRCAPARERGTMKKFLRFVDHFMGAKNIDCFTVTRNRVTNSGCVR